MTLPVPSPRMPRRRSRVLRPLSRGLLRLLGWRIEGTLPDEPKLVVAVAPHTTAWDFGVGMLGMFALDLRISWLGAHWLFPWWGRGVMRRLGGIAVDRSQSLGRVEQLALTFAQRDALLLGLAPEGSRSRVVPWKTGFYRIAVAAQVPLLLISLDQRSRHIGIGPSFEPTGDYEGDFEAHIRPFFAPFEERYSERFGL